ncbi:MAG: copper chaperone PCu(A)C [Acidobacteriota bacterium]
MAKHLHVRVALACVALLVLVACGETSAPRADAVRIVATPGIAALYLELEAEPGTRLVSIEAPAGRVETHATVEEDGVVRMEPRPDGFEVPASGRLSLAPGGAHGMLIEPDLPPREVASRVAITLHLLTPDGREIAEPVYAAIERMGDG